MLLGGISTYIVAKMNEFLFNTKTSFQSSGAWVTSRYATQSSSNNRKTAGILPQEFCPYILMGNILLRTRLSLPVG